jgi:hypothetical protein
MAMVRGPGGKNVPWRKSDRLKCYAAFSVLSLFLSLSLSLSLSFHCLAPFLSSLERFDLNRDAPGAEPVNIG